MCVGVWNLDNTIMMERVNLKQKHGLAKATGALIKISRAMVMTLYKGPIVNIYGSHEMNVHSSTTASGGAQYWVARTVMLLLSVIGWSAFFIVQLITLNEYPAELSLTTLIYEIPIRPW